jgi:hypothetical protein
MAIRERGERTVSDASTAAAPQRAARSDSSGERDTVIDMMRGLCMISMITSHTAPHALVAQVLHAPRFISGLDGFVCLSGYVLGLVDHRRVERYGEAGTARRIWARAGLLYLVQWGLIALRIVVLKAMGIWPEMPNIEEHGGWAVWLLNVAVWRDRAGPFSLLLSMYVMILAVAPFALAQMRRGRTWLVIAVAAAAYGAYWLGGREYWPFVSFVNPGWPLGFFLGTAVGYHSAALRRDVWPRVREWVIAAGILVFAGFLAAVTVPALSNPLGMTTWRANEGDLFDTIAMGPLRLPYFAGAAIVLYCSLNRLRRMAWFSPVGSVLQTVGSRSLYCFIAHMPFVIVTSVYGLKQLAGAPADAWACTVVAAVCLMARYRVLARVIPN